VISFRRRRSWRRSEGSLLEGTSTRPQSAPRRRTLPPMVHHKGWPRNQGARVDPFEPFTGPTWTPKRPADAPAVTAWSSSRCRWPVFRLSAAGHLGDCQCPAHADRHEFSASPPPPHPSPIARPAQSPRVTMRPALQAAPPEAHEDHPTSIRPFGNIRNRAAVQGTIHPRTCRGPLVLLPLQARLPVWAIAASIQVAQDVFMKSSSLSSPQPR